MCFVKSCVFKYKLKQLNTKKKKRTTYKFMNLNTIFIKRIHYTNIDVQHDIDTLSR